MGSSNVILRLANTRGEMRPQNVIEFIAYWLISLHILYSLS